MLHALGAFPWPTEGDVTVTCQNSRCERYDVSVRVAASDPAPGLRGWPNLSCAGCGHEPQRITEEGTPDATS